jgi:hypothetical protein
MIIIIIIIITPVTKNKRLSYIFSQYNIMKYCSGKQQDNKQEKNNEKNF